MERAAWENGFGSTRLQNRCRVPRCLRTFGFKDTLELWIEGLIHCIQLAECYGKIGLPVGDLTPRGVTCPSDPGRNRDRGERRSRFRPEPQERVGNLSASISLQICVPEGFGERRGDGLGWLPPGHRSCSQVLLHYSPRFTTMFLANPLISPMMGPKGQLLPLAPYTQPRHSNHSTPLSSWGGSKGRQSGRSGPNLVEHSA